MSKPDRTLELPDYATALIWRTAEAIHANYPGCPFTEIVSNVRQAYLDLHGPGVLTWSSEADERQRE